MDIELSCPIIIIGFSICFFLVLIVGESSKNTKIATVTNLNINNITVKTALSLFLGFMAYNNPAYTNPARKTNSIAHHEYEKIISGIVV
jgi:hypothetical protein